MKIAFTGSHGTGKTTSMFSYAHTAKLENPNSRVEVFHENASRAPKGLFNKKGTKESQLWIFTNQLRSEIELTNIYDIVVCDRTVLDPIAYAIYLGFQDLANKMFDLSLDHFSSYDMIIFKQIKTNDYLKDCQHRDTNDIEYRQRVETILLSLYETARIMGSEKFRMV